MEVTGVTYSVDHYEHYNQNGDRNYFEEVVDKMILDGISGMNDSFRNAIMSLDRDKKRMTILSLLDKDLNLFKRIKALTDKNIGKMDHIKDIILMLREYVKVGEVEKKKFGEVMTPLELVKEMLATLPEEVWSNPNLKWLDPANGTGPYPIMVIYKLMNGLKDWEPDAEKRYKHIVENMIYVCELQPKNMFLYMCAIDPFDAYKLNIYTGSFLEEGFDFHMKNVWGLDKFDIVMGNPPYQDELKTKKGSAKPLYNLFTEKSIPICDKILFITPSRWFAGGKGLDSFRQNMLNSKNIRIINHFSDATIIFSDVDINGGVSYFLMDLKYNGNCKFNNIELDLSKYDILVDIKYHSIIDKVSKFKGLDTICKGQSYSGITTNDERLSTTILNDDYIKCYVSQANGLEKWINKSHLRKNIDLNKWKVITARANGSYPRFGNKFVGLPNEVCNQSYILFEVDNEIEAKNLLSYINTKFANFLLSLRKISQDLKPDSCKWIPILDFSKEWTDDLLCEFFELTDDEKKLIGI